MSSLFYPFLSPSIITRAILSASVCVAMVGCSMTPEQPKRSLENVTSTNTTSIYTLKSGGIAPQRQQGLTMPKADLSFSIIPDHQSIIGVAKLTLNTNKPTKHFSVDLDRIFNIHSIRVNGVKLLEPQYSNQTGELIVTLDNAVAGDFNVEISYDGKPRTAVRAPWDGGFVWQRTESGEHWIATAVQGEGCDLFWPCIDQPYGEVGQMDIRVTVPNNLVAATNGVLIETQSNIDTTTYHWQTSSMHNTYAIALNIGPYKVLEDTYQSHFGNSIPVQFFHLADHVEKAKGLFKEIKPMVDFFETVIGPYPFAKEKIGVAETPHLGMEHQTINAYGNQYRKDEFGYDWLLHHEFAHEWFGNQVTNSNWDHMWLHEGFGTYMQPLYTQYLHGDMAYKAHLYKQRLGLLNQYPIVSNKPLAVEEVYDRQIGPGTDIYSKGSLILHSLRALIGDDAFFASLRQLVYGTTDPKPGNFSPRFSDTNEFIAIVNYHSGQNLQWFFDVYLYQAELPSLVTERSKSSITMSWEVPNDQPFPMPIEVSINGEVKTYHLTTPKTIKVHPTDVVIFDPNAKVLRHQPHINEYKQYLNDQREAWMSKQKQN